MVILFPFSILIRSLSSKWIESLTWTITLTSALWLAPIKPVGGSTDQAEFSFENEAVNFAPIRDWFLSFIWNKNDVIIRWCHHYVISLLTVLQNVCNTGITPQFNSVDSAVTTGPSPSALIGQIATGSDWPTIATWTASSSGPSSFALIWIGNVRVCWGSIIPFSGSKWDIWEPLRNWFLLRIWFPCYVIVYFWASSFWRIKVDGHLSILEWAKIVDCSQCFTRVK